MKTIVFSDCHGNLDLITNVLNHAKSWDRAIFAGDILDIGFSPLECIDLLLDNNIELLWGNHDLAPVLNRRIHPTSNYDLDVYERLESLRNIFRVATWQDDILITHAGLSQAFYNEFCSSTIVVASQLATQLNKLHLESMWEKNGPVWYRPSKQYRPLPEIVQVVGHTPPSWLAYTGIDYPNYHTVDPYCKIGFGKDRYRYAIIENNVITVIDSNGRY